MYAINKRTKVYHNLEVASETCSLDTVDPALLEQREEAPPSEKDGENRMKSCSYCCQRSGTHGVNKTEDGRCAVCFGVVREPKAVVETPAAAEGEATAEKPKRTRKPKSEAVPVADESESDAPSGEGEVTVDEIPTLEIPEA